MGVAIHEFQFDSRWTISRMGAAVPFHSCCAWEFRGTDVQDISIPEKIEKLEQCTFSLPSVKPSTRSKNRNTSAKQFYDGPKISGRFDRAGLRPCLVKSTIILAFMYSSQDTGTWMLLRHLTILAHGFARNLIGRMFDKGSILSFGIWDWKESEAFGTSIDLQLCFAIVGTHSNWQALCVAQAGVSASLEPVLLSLVSAKRWTT